MPNILRTGGAVNILDDVVRIQDVAAQRPRPKPRPKPKPEPGVEAPETEASEAGPAFVTIGEEGPEGPGPEEFTPEEGHPAFEQGPPDDYYGDYQAVAPPAMQQDIVKSAMAEAGRILEDAVRSAEETKGELMAKAQYEADQLKKDALEEGRKQGFASIVGEMGEVTSGIENAIATFEGDRAGFEVEYEQQLKWLAVEIASKVLAKKVTVDDGEMLEMVDKAVQGIRGESWIRVEVAQEMTHLIDRLHNLYDNEQNIDIAPVTAAPGTVMIESPSGIIDASLQTQLKNLKDYFEKAEI